MKFIDKTTITSGPGQIDDNGFLRLNKVRLGRIGIQQYLGKELPNDLGFAPDEVVNVYRPEEEVFADESLSTLQGLPVVFKNHEWKTPDSNGASGSVSGIPTRAGDDIAGQLLITDGKAIIPIRNKEYSDISLGYKADVERITGTFRGQPYQAVQRNIRYNHVAILRPGGGRAGDNIKIEDNKTMDLITVDTGHGEVKVSPDSKAALKSLMDACSAGNEERRKMQDSNSALAKKVEDYDALKAKLEDAEKENEKMKGEIAAKEAKIKKMEDEDEDEEKLEKKAKEMSDAKAVAVAVMGDSIPKGLPTSKLKLEIARAYAKANGIVIDGKEDSDDFLLGIYGVASASVKKMEKKITGVTVVDGRPISDARQKFMNDLKGVK